jgi:N-acyl-D-amino-acid deacylase
MSRNKASLLLKGGTVYDGTGSEPFAADIGIDGERVSFVGPGGSADRVIDVGGLVVSPGFIDTHGHSEFTVLGERAHEGKLFQGITTEINGNCGLSAAPLLGEALEQRRRELADAGVGEPWSTLEEYFGRLGGVGLALNFATLAGHGNIRASVVGYADRRPSESEMGQMRELLGGCLRAGALGLSTGLIYPPGIYSDTREIVELARHGEGLAGERFIYASHMRSEGDRLVEAVREVLTVAREAGVKAHISHIKTAGERNWHKASEVISLIEEARADGLRVTCDRYPYLAASTDLDSVLPAWSYEGGAGSELSRLKDPATRNRIAGELRREHPEEEYWRRVCVATVGTERNRWMEGRSILEIAARGRKNPVEALLDLLVDEKLAVDAILYSMSEENLRRFLSLPFVMVGSDSAARPLGGAGRPHPRGFGTFPRFLRRYAGINGPAIHRITMLPALTFGLAGRGCIRPGYFADITVFDPETIEDRATFDAPYARAEGVQLLIVNGVPVIEGGKLTGARPGRVLANRVP